MKTRISEALTHFSDKHRENHEKMVELSDFIGAFFVSIDDDGLAHKFLEELTDFSEELTKEDIEAVLLHMHRKDGIAGIKWSCEETETVAKQFDVEPKIKTYGKTYDKALWWFAMNYAYAVHFNVNKSLAYYVDIAMDEYTNKNICIRKMVKRLHKELF